MDRRINHFVARLARARLDGPVINPYASGLVDPLQEAANSIRRENLRRYLQAMAAARPWLSLIGEAPGYRGCRLTGVPFASEAVILDQDVWPFGAKSGFRKTAEQGDISREATATMIWSALDNWQPPPLLWNAFPFHPYTDGQPASNRRPNARELQLGAGYLIHFLALFRPDTVVAVGRSAAQALDRAGLREYLRLRHPSHGGKAAFVAGLKQIEQPTNRR